MTAPMPKLQEDYERVSLRAPPSVIAEVQEYAELQHMSESAAWRHLAIIGLRVERRKGAKA